MVVDEGRRELQLKLVYYGPALSGKTTNLRALHERTLPDRRGHLMELPTADDRTLLFDTMPLLCTRDGVRIKVRVFTLPGQVLHNSTRRVVLQGADGVVFVADSQPYKRHDNFQYWSNLEENLHSLGTSLDRVPHVVQWNKADLGDETTALAIAAMRRESRRPVFEAMATRGDGVVETLLALGALAFEGLDREHGLSARLSLGPAAFADELRRSFGAHAPPLAANDPPQLARAAGAGMPEA